jgi:hypothetical protein
VVETSNLARRQSRLSESRSSGGSGVVVRGREDGVLRVATQNCVSRVLQKRWRRYARLVDTPRRRAVPR